MKFTYKQVDDYPIKDLKKNFIQERLLEHPGQHLYDEHCQYFDFYEKPVIIPDDGTVLCHWWDIVAAKAAGKTTINVITVEGFSQEDLIQFICLRDFFRRVTRPIKYFIIRYLRDYLKNNEHGKQWRNRIADKLSLRTINHIIGYITGYGDSQVSAIKTMGDKDEKYLDDEKYTFRQLRDHAEKDDKIKGSDPTKEAIREKHSKSRELKKQKHQEKVSEVWDTLAPFSPFGFDLFEGRNAIRFKNETYSWSPTYAKVEDGVLYLGVVSDDNRFKLDIIFEEDPKFKNGRYKKDDGDEWIGDEEEKEEPVPAQPAQPEPVQAQLFTQEPAAYLESVKEDALKSLQSLGISKAKSKEALKSFFQKVPFPYKVEDVIKVEDIIKEALKTFNKSHAISREARVPQTIEGAIKQKSDTMSAAQKEMDKLGRELARENPGIDRLDKPKRHNVQKKKDHA
jgi:ribosomal protein S17E